MTGIHMVKKQIYSCSLLINQLNTLHARQMLGQTTLIYVFSYFFPENRLMQTVSKGDNLHEMFKSIF